MNNATSRMSPEMVRRIEQGLGMKEPGQLPFDGLRISVELDDWGKLKLSLTYKDKGDDLVTITADTLSADLCKGDAVHMEVKEIRGTVLFTMV